MKTELADKRCRPCEGGVEPLQPEQVTDLMKGLHGDWALSDDGLEIARRFSFPAYSRTIAFANAVAWIATVEGHHPVLTVSYGDCVVSYTTHAIGGLSDNDFICAAKVDRLAADAE
jgi:4a-hydroxytetrahydrobiopterin dehydratase